MLNTCYSKELNWFCLGNVGVGENLAAKREVLSRAHLPLGHALLLPQPLPNVDRHPEQFKVQTSERQRFKTR